METTVTDNGEGVELPKTLEEVERLVQRLYLPGSPQEIAKIQHALQNIQRSAGGWQLADYLLDSRDEKARFFGALTFTIKINKDWDSLKDGTYIDLLERLLSWIVRLVSLSERPLVMRKLCSALVAYFLQSTASRSRYLRHLLCCFHANTVVAESSLDRSPYTNELLQNLTAPQLVTTLWFATTLIEEVGKTNPDRIQTSELHKRIELELEDTVYLIRFALENSVASDMKTAQEGIKTLQSWVMYAQRAWGGNLQTIQLLKGLNSHAIYHLESPDMFDVAQEFLSDVLTNFPSFLTDNDYDSIALKLCSSTSQKYISALSTGNFESEQMAFGRLLLAFGDARVQDLARDYLNQSYRFIMGLLMNLLICEGYAVAEDEICFQALEFWTTYVEFLIDSSFAEGDDKPIWIEQALGYVVKVVEASWLKIRMPPEKLVVSWDSDTKVGFKAFRADVADLIQFSYTLLGISMFDRFILLAVESLDNQAWFYLEASLYCLSALSDSVADEEIGDQSLSNLFSSTLYTTIANNGDSIPPKTKQTAVTLINRYATFFERHTEYLLPTLSFLFLCLRSPELATVTAKAIFAICSSCRKHLVSKLGAFLEQYDTLFLGNHMDDSTKEKVLGCITAVIQALPSDGEKLDPLGRLLTYVEEDIRHCLRLLSLDQLEEAQSLGLDSLRCLASMGRALQAPDDLVIDLDSDERKATVWELPPGQEVRRRIMACLYNVLTPLRHDGDIVEATCQVIRTGFTETSPGPFVFPPAVMEAIVVQSGLNTARLGYVLDTAGVMLSRQAASINEILPTATRCLGHVLQLIEAMNSKPDTDPEVASNCIDFANKFIPHYLVVFSDLQIKTRIPDLLQFTLQCLLSTETLPKRSAAAFWTFLIQVRDQSTPVQEMINNTIQEYGPHLAQVLMRGIGGEAARSDLDALAEPLKKMISSQSRAKQWFEGALSSQSFPSQLVGDTEKRVWLQKVITLRGAKSTNHIVKDFWMACRGTNITFAS